MQRHEFIAGRPLWAESGLSQTVMYMSAFESKADMTIVI
jgi:hypothetical protein